MKVSKNYLLFSFFFLLFLSLKSGILGAAKTGSKTASSLSAPGPVGEIFRREGKSVLEIETDEGQGSGVIIARNGILVTNYHVVQGARWAVARTVDGRVLPVQGIIEADKTHDLALIKVKSSSAFVPITLGDSDKVRIGDSVVAIGNPEGFQNTLSTGIISGFRLSFGNLYWGFKLFQITAPISPGSSGGALLDEEGHLIGITSAGYVAEAENLNVAVPINYIKPMLPRNGHLYFIQKYATKQSSSVGDQVSEKFMNMYLYLTRKLVQSMAELIEAEEKAIGARPMTPDITFYEERARLAELASLFNLGTIPSDNLLESYIKFDTADMLLDLSESDEDFIRAFNENGLSLSSLDAAKEKLKQARAILFKDASDLLGERLPYGAGGRLLDLLEKQPLLFRGDLYYGMIVVPNGKTGYRVVVVYPDSPASQAGLKAGNILVSQPEDAFSSAYKKQILFLEEASRSKPVTIIPVRFGFFSKPTVIGIRTFQNQSISPQASNTLQTLFFEALSRFSGIDPVIVPEDSARSIAQDASEYGLDFLLEGGITRFEMDSVYSLSPSLFEGYDLKIDATLNVYDPFGQQADCCKPQEIDARSPVQEGMSETAAVSEEIVENFVKQMETAGILKIATGKNQIPAQ